MKQLTINIPDYFYSAFMEYFKRIPEASVLNESSFVLSEEHMLILDKSSSYAESECISVEELNAKLKRHK
jgi:hypothetical protein